MTSPSRTPPRAFRRHAWPLAPPHPVLRAFERPPTPYLAGHRGVDLGAAPDAVVLASADGTVHFAGTVGRRQVVSLAHAGNLRTTYEPVTPLVSRGQRVTRGTPVGTLDPGHEGCRTTCLHWAALRPTPHRHYLDPLSLLARTRVRLLPTDPHGGSPTAHHAPRDLPHRTGLRRKTPAARAPPARLRVPVRRSVVGARPAVVGSRPVVVGVRLRAVR
ncbi:M23 family metallopeptidase [Actinosynnema sp. NPDC050436]|uniref:M23 family metallopeptidase n=1 Tax=Actinosynnema sp. NPDC050436 TaxID=3155659 RepID=UPI0033D0336C